MKVGDEAVRMAMECQECRERRIFKGKLGQAVGITAAGVFFAYLVLSWMAGEPW